MGPSPRASGSGPSRPGAEYRVYLSNYTDFEHATAALRPPSWGAAGGNFTQEYVTADGGGTSFNETAQQGGFDGARWFTGAGGWYVSRGFGVRPAFSQKYLALYSQNDWKVTPKLTLNLGLRWDYQPATTDRFNRILSIDLSEQNTWGTQGVLAFSKQGGNGRSLWDNTYDNFAPRVGAAYRLSESIVLRGGYGITYLPTNTGYFDGPFTYGMGSFAPYTNVKPFGTTPSGAVVGHFWENGPAITINPPAGQADAPQNYGDGGTMFRRHDYENGRSEQWNFFVEKRQGSSWFASAGYVGSRGRNLQNARVPIQSFQDLPASTLSQWRTEYLASNGTHNPAYDPIDNPYQPGTGNPIPFSGYLGNTTVARYIPLMPYPMLDGVGLQTSNGFSSYHSLQLKLTRAYSNGLQLSAHYTWSKALEYSFTELQGSQSMSDSGGAGGSDFKNLQNNKHLAFTDIPHRFLVIGTYELPFGKGQMYEFKNRFARTVLGGWKLGGVLTLQSGLPFGADGLCDGGLICRPERIQGASVEVPKELQRWYDGKTTVKLPGGRQITPCTNCFLKYNIEAFQGHTITASNGKAIPDLFWVGSGAVTYADMRQPGRRNLDATLTRAFSVTERLRFDFVASFTNVLNHTQLSGNYNLSLGGTNLVADPTTGLKVGQGTNSNFGTIGVGAFEARQAILGLKMVF